MGKVFGSSCLIAGTAIGGGMLALPLILAKVGLIQALGLMVSIWLLAYYSALLGSELNLRAQAPLSLGSLAHHFSGQKAKLVGQVSFMLLCYALLAAYMDGSSSVIASLLKATPEASPLDAHLVIHGIAIGLGIILLLSTKLIDYTNRILFLTMVTILFLLIGVLFLGIKPRVITQVLQPAGSALPLLQALPVVFTSFGFQIIFHTICGYLELDPLKIRRAFFWGSLIPAISYVCWTLVTLMFMASHQPELFTKLLGGSLAIGDFIYSLSQASDFPLLKLLAWILSVLAIITSAIGVGLGLTHSWRAIVSNRFLSVILTILPPYFIAYKVPEAFIHALGFAGMVLVIIALLLPLYLLYRSDYLAVTYYKVLDNKPLRLIVMGVSSILITIEILHLLKWL
jgi:tyrosine-specific transport protein